MTARADCTIWLDGEVPTVRAQALTATYPDPDDQRASLSIGDALVVFGPVDTLRATLSAALEALDGLPS